MATTPPTWRCSWPNPPGFRRVKWHRCWPRTVKDLPGIANVEVAGPGFLNITLEAAAQGELARTIVRAGAKLRAERLIARGFSVNLEFISANPDRPAPSRTHPLGGRRRRHGQSSRSVRRQRSPRVLHQ